MSRKLNTPIFVFAILAAGLFFGLGVGRASAATYYVSTLGTDDALHGTSIDAGAWRTPGYALTSNRIAYGDTLNIQAGVYQIKDKYIQIAAGTHGTATVQAYQNDTVTFDLDPTAVNQMFLYGLTADLLNFKKINFTNSGAINKLFWNVQGDNNIQFDSCIFDFNNAAPSVGAGAYNLGGTVTVASNQTFNRCVIKNISSYDFINSTQTITTGGQTITLNANKVDNYAVFVHLYSNATINAFNNTFTKHTGYTFLIGQNATASPIHIKNNIDQIPNNNNTNGFLIFYPGATGIVLYYQNNPTQFDVTNNILWKANPTSNLDIENLLAINVLVPDNSNRFIDPSFVDYTGGDYHLNALTNVSGKGASGNLPVGGDINGAAWTGSDVGAYANPTSTNVVPVLTQRAAFVGDSIMYGNSATPGNEAFSVFQNLSGITTAGLADNTAIVGLGVKGLQLLVDRVAYQYAPKVAFVSIGINNMGGGFSNQQLADNIVNVLSKISSYGITPVWLGIESTLGNPPDNTNVNAINNLVEASCTANGWKYASILHTMTGLNSLTWKTDYYADLINNVHPNNNGQALIGSIAEYLYYSHHTIGMDKIDIGAGARIYGDGKFRDLNTVSNNLADLSVTPSGGYQTYDTTIQRPQVLDITNLTWSNTGNHHKVWTESSTTLGAMNTVHTIGDLEANKNYNVSVDAILGQNISGTNGTTCNGGVCKANAQGKISFLYTGGYSTHTFDVTEGDNTPPVITGVSNNQTYYTTQNPTFNEGTATLNGNPYTSGNSISAVGDYTLVVTDAATNNTTIAFSIAKTKTITDAAQIAADYASGAISISGSNPTQTSQATFNTDYSIQVPNIMVTIPQNTQMTKTGGGNLNLAQIVSQETTAIDLTSVDPVKVIKFGIPNMNLTFSQPITLSINVGAGYEGQTLKVYDQKEGESTWNSETTCAVSNGICSFQVTHATKFAAAKDKIVVAASATSSSGNNHHKSHHAKKKTFKQKMTKKFNDTKKWVKKQEASFNRNLSLGSQGQDVGMLQTALQKMGLLKLRDTTYGVYKSLTQEAVTKLQQIKNILPSGNFGWSTRSLFKW